MSGKRLQLKRGTTAQTSTFTGLNGEVTVDTNKDTLVVHDGATVGGFPLAKESVLNSHTARIDNPHSVTKAQVGLGNANNTADSVKVVASAGKITTSRTISLSGDATGSVNFDGSANADIVVTVGNDTHTHTFSNLTEKPTTLSGYGITDAATISSLNTEKSRIDAILLSAGASTDTFAEIVTLINSVDTTNDTAFSGYVTSNNTRSTTIETNVANKVDKVAGKQLSTEDYSTAEKSKLAGISANANNYTHPTSGVGAGTYKSVTVDVNGHVTGGTNPTTVSGYGLTDVYTKTESNTTLALKVNNLEKGVANGVATLDVNGKVVLTQIPDSVLGQLEYMGTRDFTTLPTATQKGQYWIASVSGNGYIVGDWAVWNGSAFDKVDNTDAVATVAGRTGNVVLTKSDVGLANVDNTADSAKPVSTAQQTAIDTKVAKVTSTDNAIVRFNGTTGEIQNSGVTIDDNNVVSITNSNASYGLEVRDNTGNAGIKFANTGINSGNIQLSRSGNKLSFQFPGTSEAFYINGNNHSIFNNNVGIGVTPSAWRSVWKAIEISTGSYFYGTALQPGISANAYDSEIGWVYKENKQATRADQVNGLFRWFNAPAGTVGDAITFTQAMTLANTGNLLVGTTTDNGVDKLQVNGSISDSVVRYISSSFNTNIRIRVTISLPENTGSSGRIEVIRARGVNTFFNTVFGRQYNETPTATDINGTTTKTITTNKIILEYADADGLYDMYSIVGYVTKNCTVTVTTY